MICLEIDQILALLVVCFVSGLGFGVITGFIEGTRTKRRENGGD